MAGKPKTTDSEAELDDEYDPANDPEVQEHEEYLMNLNLPDGEDD